MNANKTKQKMKKNFNPLVILPLIIEPINYTVPDVIWPLGKEYPVADSTAFS